MKIESRKISELIAYDGNPKTHPKKQIELLKKSILEFGWTVPVLIDRDDIVIAGHGRLEAALRLGLTEAPTICLADLTPSQAQAYRIADNKLTEIGGWDPHLLAIELEALQIDDFDLELTGFNTGEIARLMDPFSGEEDGEPEAKTIECPSCGHEFVS